MKILLVTPCKKKTLGLKKHGIEKKILNEKVVIFVRKASFFQKNVPKVHKDALNLLTSLNSYITATQKLPLSF